MMMSGSLLSVFFAPAFGAVRFEKLRHGLNKFSQNFSRSLFVIRVSSTFQDLEFDMLL